MKPPEDDLTTGFNTKLFTAILLIDRMPGQSHEVFERGGQQANNGEDEDDKYQP